MNDIIFEKECQQLRIFRIFWKTQVLLSTKKRLKKKQEGKSFARVRRTLVDAITEVSGRHMPFRRAYAKENNVSYPAGRHLSAYKARRTNGYGLPSI